jgi:osmoprotectant transport system permease protein
MSNELIQGIMEHMLIVFIAISISSLLGVTLGVIAYWVRFLDKIILWFSEIMQTIPSLALLAMLMILFGLGDVTLIVGLVLYALLPIVRNTFTGLESVPQYLKDAARGMGMSKIQRLFKIEIPLSFPLIFSGMKIALVNSLSIAVMGVLIGSNGLGSIIYRGIQSRNMERIIIGAIPVILMALVFDFTMSKIEKRLIKRAK